MLLHGVVAIARLFLVADPKKRGLQHVEVPPLDQIWEELQKERDQQQANVHAVHIRIRGDDHLVVTQGVQSILDVEGRLKQIEFFILVDHLLGQPKTVQGLSLQTEDGLCRHISRLGDRA